MICAVKGAYFFERTINMKKITSVSVLLASFLFLTSCDTLRSTSRVNSETEYTDEAVQTVITEVTTVPSQTSTVESAAVPVITQIETSAAAVESLETQESSLESDVELGEALSPEQTSEFFTMHQDEYLMSSGAGGWAAYLTVNPDGTFDYNYHDFDAGYYYICHAEGSFGSVSAIDDKTYALTISQMTYEYDEGAEWSETDTDGSEINYVAADSYGIHQGDTLTFYVQGSAVADLPEGYVVWYAMPRALPLENVPDPFPLSGFYNPADDCSFIEDDYE